MSRAHPVPVNRPEHPYCSGVFAPDRKLRKAVGRLFWYTVAERAAGRSLAFERGLCLTDPAWWMWHDPKHTSRETANIWLLRAGNLEPGDYLVEAVHAGAGMIVERDPVTLYKGRDWKTALAEANRHLLECAALGSELMPIRSGIGRREPAYKHEGQYDTASLTARARWFAEREKERFEFLAG